jgi:hypothetical protein
MSLADQYAAVCQTVCVNLVEAFAAEALAAMGIVRPRDELRRNFPPVFADTADAPLEGGAGLDGRIEDGSEGSGEESEDCFPWLEARISKWGVKLHKYVHCETNGAAKDPLDVGMALEEDTVGTVTAVGAHEPTNKPTQQLRSLRRRASKTVAHTGLWDLAFCQDVLRLTYNGDERSEDSADGDEEDIDRQ